MTDLTETMKRINWKPAAGEVNHLLDIAKAASEFPADQSVVDFQSAVATIERIVERAVALESKRGLGALIISGWCKDGRHSECKHTTGYRCWCDCHAGQKIKELEPGLWVYGEGSD